LEVFGPFAGIAQFVKLEVENLHTLMGYYYQRNIITEGLYLLITTIDSVVFGQYNDISCMHMLCSNCMVLFTLMDLQSQCTGQVSEPVNICLGKVLKKSLNW